MIRLVALFVLVSVALFGKVVSLVTPDGEMAFELDTGTTTGDVLEVIAPLIEKSEIVSIELDQAISLTPQVTSQPGSSIGHPREYYRDVTPSEKADLRFIVTTLADRSIVSLALSRGDLEVAGDRIAHLHPLRFLMTIFSDEELKVGIRNIRGKGWVWGQFLAGLRQSFVTESNFSNIKPDHVNHFSKQVGIHPKIILSAINAKDWDRVVELLITHVPRSSEGNRYDM